MATYKDLSEKQDELIEFLETLWGKTTSKKNWVKRKQFYDELASLKSQLSEPSGKDWNKLNKKFDDVINNLTDEQWDEWYNNLPKRKQTSQRSSQNQEQKEVRELTDEIIEDGFGSAWSKRCPECGKMTMVITRPGKVQCMNCG